MMALARPRSNILVLEECSSPSISHHNSKGQLNGPNWGPIVHGTRGKGGTRILTMGGHSRKKNSLGGPLPKMNLNSN